ncbi:MAG: rod shape-determining protein RodA [Chloroflexota bacterium]
MRTSIWHRFDWALLIATLCLVALGCVMIYSAYEVSAPTPDGAWLDNIVFRQGLFAAIGFLAYLAMAALDYRVLARASRWIYLAAMAALGATLVIGRTAFGAQSWLDVPTFGPQPSEFVKVMVIIVLGGLLSGDKSGLESPRALALSVLAIVPPVALIYLQPDFGTAMIVVVTWAAMAFLAGVRWQHLLVLGLLALVAVPVVWFRLEGYMRDRLFIFLTPGHDPSGASYNINQALISIGSGGLWGKGLFRGTQTQLHFLRVRHTDFIFSVLAEELGFAGSLLLLILFVFLGLRLIRIAATARDAFGRLLVSGVAAMILAQAFINLGMNANILPVTGLPLPLVSYGGSSLIATLLGLGLAQSVAMRQQPAEQAIV